MIKNVWILGTGGTFLFAHTQPWHDESPADYLARIQPEMYGALLRADVDGVETAFHVFLPSVKSWMSQDGNQAWFNDANWMLESLIS